MKITILGAGGNIGQRITKEAAARNHELRLITSKTNDFFGLDNAQIQQADIFDTNALTNALQDSDVVISAYGPPHTDTDAILDATSSLINASKKANTRLISVGGAGSLQVTETLQLVDSPDFPAEYKTLANSHRKALENLYYNETDLNWTNVSPAAYIFEGEKTNKFRIGGDNLIVDDKGQSSISMEDFAVAVLNEAEAPEYAGKRMTVGY